MKRGVTPIFKDCLKQSKRIQSFSPFVEQMPEREQMKKIDNVITLQEIPAQSIVSALS